MMQQLFFGFEESEFFLLVLLCVLLLLLLPVSRFINAFLEIKSEKNHKRIVNITFIISLALYSLSLFFKCYYDKRGSGDEGLTLLIFGGIGVLGGGAGITWLANPLLWYAWLKRSDAEKSRIASFLSCFFSLFFLGFDSIPCAGGGSGGTDMFFSCNDLKIYSYGLGYYLWLASSLVFLIGNCFRQKKCSDSLMMI